MALVDSALKQAIGGVMSVGGEESSIRPSLDLVSSLNHLEDASTRSLAPSEYLVNSPGVGSAIQHQCIYRLHSCYIIVDGPMDHQVDGVKVETKRPGLKTPAEVRLYNILVAFLYTRPFLVVSCSDSDT